MDGGGGFWDWSEELRFLQHAEGATQVLLDERSESAQNAASVSIQIDQFEVENPLLIDLTSDHSYWEPSDGHTTSEQWGVLAPVHFGQWNASDPVNRGSTDEACGLSLEIISTCVLGELDRDSAPDRHRIVAHSVATVGGAGQETAHGGAVYEGESPCPPEGSGTDSSEPIEIIDSPPQDVTVSQEDGGCGNASVCVADNECAGDWVCADERVWEGSTDQEAEAHSPNLSPRDGTRVRLQFDFLEAEGCKNSVSEDDARPAAECRGSIDATRGRIFVLPFPLTIPFLPLRAVGLLAHPLRHVPKIAFILLTSVPTPRPQQLEPREIPGVLPATYRRRKRSRRGAGRGHFTRKHFLLDLTAPDWLQDNEVFSQSEHPSPRSSSTECAEQMSSESSLSSSQAQEHCEQLNGAGGFGESRADDALGGDPVTSAHGLLVSANTSADPGLSPRQKRERSRPSQLDINEASPLTNVHSRRWETDSFSLEYSPSSLSLDGGFRYRSVDGGAEVSPMSSRSSSSSDLGEPGMHSDTGSSTDENDSHLYLPTNYLLLTPPPNLAAAEPPVKPLSEMSRRFVLPPGVMDPAEMEDLEQQWADQLRARRAEHGDQHYMSAAELMSPPWSDLVFWHGSDKKGQPVLYCKLGLAVRTLPRHMQDRMGCALYSMVELAENSLWRPECGWGFQRMTVVVDAEGLGITRMAPVEALKHGFKLIHRDYPARQGYTYIINVPPLLSMMIGVFKRVIGYDEKEANERLGVYGRNYRSHLQKDFEPDMLHVDYGGSCPCCSAGDDKELVTAADSCPANAGAALKRRGRPEDWVLDFVPSHQR